MDRGEHRRAVDAFLQAVLGGDMEALLEILDPEVVWRSDGGGKVAAARVPVVGNEKVARFAQRLGRGFDPATMVVHRCAVNDAPGLVIADRTDGQAVVFAFSVDQGLITEIDVIVNPDKLRHLDLPSL
ncbi:RNA polymerase sigma24 factor OS=Streptomyces antimycoticus OX=68175 GN=rpoE_1 PE=3 SV=1 [Streptomyces antimycoticus]